MFLDKPGGIGQTRDRVALGDLKTQRLTRHAALFQRTGDERRKRPVLDARPRQVDA